MLSDKKEIQDFIDMWGIRFARAYAEFVRALSEGTITPSLQPPPVSFSTNSNPAVPLVVDEVSESDDPHAVKRSKEAHEAWLVAVRDETVRPVDFDPEVPAKAAGSRLRQIFKERGIRQSDIARRLGVAPSVISRVFKYPERSRLRTIRNIADAAGIAIGDLI